MTEFNFTAFVQNLPKEKLVELVIKYAPESYREEVSNQNLKEEKARKVFDKAVKDIHGLFEDDELLYEPSDFASSIEAFSEKLMGLKDRYPDRSICHSDFYKNVTHSGSIDTKLGCHQFIMLPLRCSPNGNIL